MKNQVEQARFIKTKFSKYLKSQFDIRDETYRELYYQRLEELESKLYKGPYIASTLPFEPSKSINELIESNQINPDFRKIGNLDFNRPCYAHQVKSIERIKKGKNLVVTTGTGSGKTECFMFPIINNLIEELKSGNTESGVRVIFLFPLNALVYDQIDRLRGLLENYPELRFGFYTGRTPENSKTKEGKKLINSYKKKYGNPLPNELITREEIRKNPPQILFTNYSMLEYLLIRPTDEQVISKDALKFLKFIVLDEAHTYRGSLGIEISLLLRRLKAIADKKPQFILTSATLGRGAEDIDKIIEFAENLTSSTYEKDDIVFAQRHPMIDKTLYAIDHEDYKALFENISNIDVLRDVFEKYLKYDDSLNLKNNLYYLLSYDENTHFFFHKTKNVGSFAEVLNSMYNFSEEELTSMIELITMSQSKNGLKLLDIKYHMFMKAPDGAFITLGKKNLSLLTVNQIDGYKAFKIGICQNCKVPYIMGITENHYLCIDDEIDIDEAYANKAKRLEYYLIEDCLTPEEIIDINSNKDFQKFEICSKCGFIRPFGDQSQNLPCNHENQYKKILYKFVGKNEYDLDEDDVVMNNLHRCPICEYKSNAGGVIMGFHVGKDRATTLISQMLYESMEYPKLVVKASGNSLFKKADKIIDGRKQFLAFSDSRQQAAFFSKFLNANNDKFMKKTIMWELVNKLNHESTKFSDVVDLLYSKFKNELGYDEDNAKKHAKATALWELMLVDGRNSGEGLGMYAFKLNLETENYNNSELLESALSECGFAGISAKEFKDLTAQVFTIFRKTPAIDYGTLDVADYEEKKELLGYRQRTAYIKEQSIKKAKGENEYTSKIPVISFLPALNPKTNTCGVNNVVKYVQKVFGYDKNKAIELLRLVFNTAVSEGILNPVADTEYLDCYTIKSNRYNLLGYKNLKYYKCSKCNKLTIYNLNNKCTEADCDGILEPCDVNKDEKIQNNYYRNEYLSRRVEHLICREHTAQLNADEAKEIQDDFKSEKGKTNFISCSTTFEMGIDLGGLNTVFMRNVPPTPANYAQRAGRAGRRAETSAFILTFCGNSSHDYTYFSNPAEMIRGLVRPPYFVIDNEKIIMRHITATALSLFFRRPDFVNDFDTVSKFIENDVKNKFLNFIKEKPLDLGVMIDKYLLLEKGLFEKYGNFKWVNYLSDSESALNNMETGLKGLISLYREAEKYASDNKQYKLADSYKTALNRLNSPNSLVSYFTKYNVIPGYGFPVDNVELHIYNFDTGEMDDEYNLSRNLSIALSEYAPSSEIIVDGKKYTSRYLFLPHNGYSLPKTYYCECEKCHIINTNVDKNYFVKGVTCKYCGEKLNTSNVKEYTTPIYGFVADSHNKDTRRIKPFKTYASDIYYIGDDLSVPIDGVVSVTEHKDEKLMVLNENNFFMCPHCGYTDLDKKNLFPSKILEHREYRGSICKGCGSKLELTHLGHSYRTDIIQIGFNGINEMFDKETALSVLFAILEGISMTFNIERNDINGILYKSSDSKPYSLILFDSVAGGSGHVKRLKESNALLEVLKNALRKVSQNCCAEDTSCYNCLRTYNNQKLHKHLKRGLAKRALQVIIEKIKNNSTKYNVISISLDFANIEPNDFLNAGYLMGSSSENAVRNLFKEIEYQKADYPSGFGYVLKSNTGDTVFADFIWTEKNIIAFSIENEESYIKMLNSSNNSECVLLTDSLDYVEFVNKLRE